MHVKTGAVPMTVMPAAGYVTGVARAASSAALTASDGVAAPPTVMPNVPVALAPHVT